MADDAGDDQTPDPPGCTGSQWDTAASGYTFITSDSVGDNERCLPDQYHHSFASCFCLAHQLGIDFMNITWQPARGSLGTGASSIVNESDMITKQLSFAFKRTVPRRDQPQGIPGGTSKSRFRALVSEVLVLRHPAVREHRNVARLEGIAWEFHNHDVWPVLVFPRADRGSLAEFITSDEGKDASFEGKIRICIDIGLALDALHNNMVIHGDIKPSNVLVYLVDGAYVAKLIDFESSCICESEDDLVTLPRTEPWDAPEWHHRHFTMRNAKRMDVYSYQLVCFFTLFQASFDLMIVDALPSLKANNELPGFVDITLSLWSDLSPYQNSCISQFFKVGLGAEPEEREIDMETLLRFLTFDPTLSLNNRRDEAKMDYPDPHSLDSIISTFSHLGSSDFRVRRFLATSLKAAAQDESCAPCASNAAFALAFGWEVGFFIRDGEDDPGQFSEKSRRSAEVFRRRVTEFCRDLNPQAPIPRAIEEHQALWYHDVVQAYRIDGVLPEASEFLKAEVDARSLILGPDHVLSRAAKLSLASILRDFNRLDDAQRLFQQVLQSCERLGDELGAADATESLAVLNANRGRWTDAEGDIAASLNNMKKVAGEKGVLTLEAMVRMSAIYHGQAKYAEAVDLVRAAVAGFAETLGPNHLRTISAMESLAKSLTKHGHGDLKEALQMMEVVIDGKKRLLGENNRSTLSSMEQLIRIQSLMGHPEHAIVQLKNIIKTQTELLGALHADTLSSEATLVQCHIQREDWEAALPIEESLAGKRSRSLGPQHPETLRCQLNLAAILGNLGNVDGAITIITRVVEERRKLMGDTHPDTISAKGSLSSAFRKKGMLSRAEDLGNQVLSGLRAACGEKSPLTLTAMESLAAVYIAMDRVDEAEQLLASALGISTDLSGPESPDTLRLTRLYANAVRDATEAEALRQRVLDIQRQQLGETSTAILTQENNLAEAMMRQGRWGEARNIFERVLPSAEEVLGHAHTTRVAIWGNLAICQGQLGDLESARGTTERIVGILGEEMGDDDTRVLHHKANLASLLMRSGKLEDSEALASAVLEDLRRVNGDDHPETMRVMNNLAAVYSRQQRWSEVHALLTHLVGIATVKFGPDDPRTGAYREQADAIALLLLVEGGD